MLVRRFPLKTAPFRALLRKASGAVVDSLRPIENFTRRLINASVTSDLSYNHRDAAKLWSAIPQTSRPSTPPSMSKTQFLAQNHLLSGTQIDPLDFALLNGALRPGAFVELRRNNIVTHGIVLHIQILEARKHSFTLTYTGEVWPHLINDITYIIPNFVSQDILERAGDGYESSSTSQTTARLQIVEQIRTFTRQHERHFNAISKDIYSLYDKVRHQDPDKWADITTPEATKFLDVKRPPPVLTLFAMHAHMMAFPLWYVADPRNHRTTHKFAVRPLSHVQIILQMNEWVRTRDPAFQSFTEKARNVIKKSREVQEKYCNSHVSRFEGRFPPWTPSDLTFVRYLQNALRTTRTIQEDPYDVALSSLVKAIDMYRDHPVGPGLAQLVLSELGVLAPWEDPVSRTPEIRLNVASPGESRELQTIDELVRHCLTKPSTPVSSILRRKLHDVQLSGSTELLHYDPLEAHRRDFGDMPVYVVDDDSAQELDDGISIENIPGEPGKYWIHVHIADPTAAIPPGHVLDLQAKKAVLTFYTAHRTWPMLPAALAKALFSLGAKSGREGQEVLTFSVKMSDNGDILDYRVQGGLVRNLHILTYGQVDRLLGLQNSYYSYPFPETQEDPVVGNTVPETCLGDLRKLRKIADRFYYRTLELNPIINFTFPKATVSFRQELPINAMLPPVPVLWKGYPSMKYIVQHQDHCPYGFRQVVAEYMKLAGRAASRFCVDRGLPAIRRASMPLQGATLEDTEYLISLRSPTGYVDPFECIARNMYAPPGEPTLTPLQHWGLGIPDGEGYTRVTSPLRRYGDLIMHWQIQHALLPGNKDPLFSEEYLMPLMHNLYEKEKALIAAEMVYSRHWALTYLERHIRNERRKHGSKYEPFPNLLARTTASVGFDTMQAVGQVSVLIPSLGVQGELKGVDDQVPLPIGTTIAVKISDFKLGMPSVLQLSLA